MQDRQVIARILHGAHLFGTATENSDTDYRSVVLPSRDEILLGRINRSSNDDGTSDSSRPNTRFDVDDEQHDLARFVSLLAAGQPMALEMLFAPRRFHEFTAHPAWNMLAENADRIVSKSAGKFVGYCKRQAMAYGLKGERVAAAEAALDCLEALIQSHGGNEKLTRFIPEIVTAVSSEHVGTEFRTMASGREIGHLRIASKMAAETVTLKQARAIASGVVQEYGKRARVAMDASGKDWKALSHALRIGYEAVELLSEGVITLPRPEAAHLLAVKRGEADADAVGEEIVGLLEKVEVAMATSHLREEPDMPFLEGVVLEHHAQVVIVAAQQDSIPSP